MSALKRIRIASLALVLAVSSLGPAVPAAGESPDQVRATFLLLLGKYVTWPASAFKSPNAPLVISVVGNPGLAREMQGQAAGFDIEGHPVEVRSVPDAASSAGSHIVFVPTAEESRALAGTAPLRVSEDTKRLGDTDIAIKLQEGRVAFSVNRKEVERRGMKLGSKLMRVASSCE